MATIELKNTPFDENFVGHMRETHIYDLPKGHSHQIMASIIWAMARYLSAIPNKNEETHGVYYNDAVEYNKKNFCGILQFDKNEDNPENPGAYEFTLSYDNEICDLAQISAKDLTFSAILTTTLLENGGISISEPDSRYIICSELLTYLKKFMRDQIDANRNEIIEFDIPGIVIIRGGVEDNEAVISLVPGADIKSKAVKDDLSSEK